MSSSSKPQVTNKIRIEDHSTTRARSRQRSSDVTGTKNIHERRDSIVVGGKTSNGKRISIGLELKDVENLPTTSEEYIDINDFDCFDINKGNEKKDKFIRWNKDLTNRINNYQKEDTEAINKEMNDIKDLVNTMSIEELNSTIKGIGTFSITKIFTIDDFYLINANATQLTALEIINKLLLTSHETRKNILFSSGRNINKFSNKFFKLMNKGQKSATKGKETVNDKIINELLTFTEKIMEDNENTYELTENFIISGGFKLISNLLQIHYNEKTNKMIKQILSILNEFLEIQSKTVTKFKFCSRNVVLMLFMQEKILDGLIQITIESFLAMKFEISRMSVGILIQLLEYDTKNETSIKIALCQRIVALKLVDTITSTIERQNEEKHGRQVVFKIFKLCKMIITENETIPLLSKTPITTSIVRVMNRCSTLSSGEINVSGLRILMKNGSIYNVIQYLETLCSNKDSGAKICRDLSSINGTFLLLKLYHELSLSTPQTLEESIMNIIICVCNSMKKQQSQCDFINNHVIEFLITRYRTTGISTGFMKTIISLYNVNRKKGFAELTTTNAISSLFIIFNKGANKKECCTELLE